jgi:hypothetical protein
VQTDVFGWGTNKATKAMAIGYLVNAFSQPLQRVGETTYGLLIHDEETFTELKDYISDEKGGFCNGEGSMFDDRVMALGITLATHYIDPSVPVYTASSVPTVAKEVIEHMADNGPTEMSEDMEEAIGAPSWEEWEA